MFGVYKEEIERWMLPGNTEFDGEIFDRLRKIGLNYLHQFRRQLWEYAATYRVTSDIFRVEIESLIKQLGSDHFLVRKTATRKLAEFGEPAALLIEKNIERNNIHDAEIQARIRKILGKHRPQRVLINRKGLDHDIVFLSKGFATVPATRNRLLRILPEGTSVESAELWWKEHGHRYQWDAVLQKYRLK